MAATRSDGFLRYFKLEWSVHFQCLSSVVMLLLMQNHVAMFSNFDGICVSDNLRLGPLLVMEV